MRLTRCVGLFCACIAGIMPSVEGIWKCIMLLDMKDEQFNYPTMNEMKFTCEWCGRDTFNQGDYLGYTLHGPGDGPFEPIELCRNCFISAVQALQFGKEVMQDCLINGNGRRIYVAVEATSGGDNELVNALVWPNTPLSEHAKSAARPSISYRLSPDSLDSPVQ